MTALRELSPEERETVLHALGSSHPKYPLGWRNYYCTSFDDPKLEALVEAGWMARAHQINTGRDRYYHVTREGMLALNVNPDGEQ